MSSSWEYYFVEHAIHSSRNEWTPNTDVMETKDSFIVRMEIAGVDPKTLELKLTNQSLVVRGHRREPPEEAQFSYHQMEIRYGVFEQHIRFSGNVIGSRVQAKYHHGFLHIKLPKSKNSLNQTFTILIERIE